MKKKILPILLLALVAFVTLSCEQSIYDLKTVNLKNESELNITFVEFRTVDGQLNRLSSEAYIPVIYSGETKEYAVPYLKTAEGNKEVYLGVYARPSEEDRRSPYLEKVIVFTFDTNSNEDVTITLKEVVDEDNPDEIEYLFIGEGSGFEEVPYL